MKRAVVRVTINAGFASIADWIMLALTRILYIAGGLIISAIALWFLGIAWDQLSTPFAGASVISVGAGLVMGGFGLMVLACAFAVAFGPSRPE